MSTVMHCYRIAKDKWWEFAEQVHKFYVQTHVITKAIEGARIFDEEEQKVRRRSLLDLLKREGAFGLAELQLFEEKDGEHYLFRLLEKGYKFLNSFEEQGWPIEPVFYDDRTDIPPEHEKNAALADWCDKMIDARRYFLWPIISHTEVFQWVMDWEVNAEEIMP